VPSPSVAERIPPLTVSAFLSWPFKRLIVITVMTEPAPYCMPSKLSGGKNASMETRTVDSVIKTFLIFC
jgi:hypothetical protein